MPVEMYCRDVGTGLPVVLLHAFPLSSAMWLEQRESLASSYRIITPDQRGFGGTPLPDDEEPSLETVADDIAAMLDAKEIDRIVLGGCSMGGYVAMSFLRRYADRVAGLVLSDTRAGADNAEGAANRERIAQLLIDDPTSTVLLDEVLPKLVGATTTDRRPLIFGRVRALVQGAPPTAVAWAQRAMAARPDSADVLRGYNRPALVVVGEEDVLTPPDAAEQIAALLPNATLVRIPQAGHLPAVETPDAFNVALGDFLSALR